MSGHLSDEELEAPGEHPHLSQCAQCRGAVARARGLQKLLSKVKPYTLADVGFSRVEARLLEHVRENPPGPRWTWGRSLALAAFAGVAMLLAITTVRPLLSPKPEPAPVAAFEPMTVLYASGVVAVQAGQQLGRDAVLDAERGQVLLSTADGRALRLEGGAKMVLGTSDATVRLTSGLLKFDAQGRGPWVVQAGAHWVRSADAALEVAPDHLKVYRGSVWLADNAAFSNARQVSAPIEVVLRSGAEVALSGPADARVRPSPAPPWARLELKLQATAVELDGQKVGEAPFSLMTSPGKHRLRALVGESWRDADVELTTDGSGVVELPERAALAPVAPTPRTGPHVEADPAALAAAVKAQLPKLRVCHEKWLKVNENARGKVAMTLTVSPRGRVTRAAFAADDGVPAAVSECLGRAVRTLTLPSSSEEVELELPVFLGGN